MRAWSPSMRMSSRCSPAPCAKARAASAAMRPSFVEMSPDHGRMLPTLRRQRRPVTKRMHPGVFLPGCTGCDAL